MQDADSSLCLLFGSQLGLRRVQSRIRIWEGRVCVSIPVLTFPFLLLPGDPAPGCFISCSSPCHALWPAVGCISQYSSCPWGLQRALFNCTEMSLPTSEMKLLKLQSLAAAPTAGARPGHCFFGHEVREGIKKSISIKKLQGKCKLSEYNYLNWSLASIPD